MERWRERKSTDPKNDCLCVCVCVCMCVREREREREIEREREREIENPRKALSFKQLSLIMCQLKNEPLSQNNSRR